MQIEDTYINTLEQEFKQSSNKTIAAKQSAYLRDQFMFFGLKTTDRRTLQKPFLVKQYLPKKQSLEELIQKLWNKPERDFQLFAQELVFKYIKTFDKEDITLLEYMVVHKSWWDTVDFVAYKLMGAYFKKFPDERMIYVKKWLKSDNIWLQRSALLFQLKYKSELDVSILEYTILNLLGSKEFFINKAIGWVLREYSRTNPEWVIAFVNKTELHSLSKKEALRLIN